MDVFWSVRFFTPKSPEISVKLGEGGGGSQFFLELHTKCEVFAVFFFGGFPKKLHFAM